MNFNVCLCIIASLADVLKTVPRFLPTLLAVNHNFVQSVCEFIVDIALILNKKLFCFRLQSSPLIRYWYQIGNNIL